MKNLPLLPTSVVGSHAKMSWWYLMRQEAEAGRLGKTDLDEALDMAVDTCGRSSAGIS